MNVQSIQENPTASSTVIGYLKIPDIDGESNAARFEDQIEIFGLSSLVEQGREAQVGKGRRRARAQVSPIDVVKSIDSATPYVILASMQGKSFPDMVITLVKSESSNGSAYVIITLENVNIAKHQFDASSNRQEIMSLSYEHITVKYIANDGSEHEISYDVAAGV